MFELLAEGVECVVPVEVEGDEGCVGKTEGDSISFGSPLPAAEDLYRRSRRIY